MSKQFSCSAVWPFKRSKDVLIFLITCVIIIAGVIVCNAPEHVAKIRLSDHVYKKGEVIYKKLEDHFNSWTTGKKKPRIGCLILTAPKFHDTRAKAVMDTWGKRCDVIYFVTNRDDKEYPNLNLFYADGIPDRYGVSWGAMKLAYKFAMDNLFDKVDWFVKGDDDTYFVMENLKKYLEDKNSSEPISYGRHIWNHVKSGYLEGGASFVLSKPAIEMLVTKGFGNKEICPQQIFGNEDVWTSQCLANLGIPMVNANDSTGELFNPRTPEQMAGNIGPGDWLWLSENPLKTGIDCCSMNTVTFHHVPFQMMYVIEMLLYKIRVHGAPSWSEEHPISSINSTTENRNQ